MQNILITGANGQLGSEIKKLAENYKQINFDFIDIEQINLSDLNQLEFFLKDKQYQTVINCAAYTAVDKAEECTEDAEKGNVTIPKNLAITSKKYGFQLIHISTDYVFDGKANTPYTEESEINPASVYGNTKAAGELAILQENIQAIIIRTSWLYSTFGNNFVKTILRIGKERTEIKVVSDQFGSPTYAEDLAKTILDIIVQQKFVPGIYHYANDGYCSWFEFATEIIKLTAINCKVIPITTAEYPTKAERPAYSVFDKTKIRKTYKINIPEWKSSLKKCIDQLSI